MKHLALLFLLASCDASVDSAPDATTVDPQVDATTVAATWEADVRLTNDAAASLTTYNFTRGIALTSDNVVHVAWYDERDGRPQIYAARSRDGGTTWDPATRVASTTFAQQHAAIAASGTNVYIGWHEVQNGMFYTYLARSDDSGATWRAPVKLSTSGVNAHVSIAADGDNVHVVYGDSHAFTEIMYQRSTNRGATFGAPVQLTPNNHESWVGGITASGNRVIVSWVDYRDANEEEYIRVSDDAGVTFAPALRMTNNAADSWAPSVAIDGDVVHFAWFDRRHAEYTDADVETYLDSIGTLVGLSLPAAPARDANTYYLYTFNDRISAKITAIQQAAPGYVQNGGDAALLQMRLEEWQRRYQAWALGWEIYYKRSTDGGKTFGSDARMTNAPKLSQRPSIVAVGDRVDMVWFDARDDAAGDETQTEIYAMSSQDGGLTWNAEERLTTAAGTSMLASIAATKDRLHVVWFDGRDGNNEIYYKRQLR